MKNRLLLGTMLAISSLTGAASAQEWPTKPVTMVVPYNPGGTTDILARSAADAISADIGQPVVIENRPGASGIIGATLAAGADPDGYTIFFGNIATNVIQPIVNPAVTYDVINDFDGIAITSGGAVFIGVNAETGVETLEEFVTFLEGGASKYGTAGVGSYGQFAAEYILQRTEGEARHIPYAGSNDAVAAVMSGEVDFAVDIAVTNFIDSDKMNVLAVLSPERHPNFPDVPTAIEEGQDWELAGWYGLFAPEGTDPERLNRMSAAIEKMVQTEPYIEQVLKMGILPMYSTPSETDEIVARDINVFSEIRDRAEISIE